MASIFVLLLLASSAIADEIKFIHDPRPDSGFPKEAVQQSRSSHGAPNMEGSLPTLLSNAVFEVKIRYYSDRWKTPKEVETYLSNLLKDPKTQVYSQPIWAQGFMVPDIECTIMYRVGEGNAARYSDGKLLVWDVAACIQSPDGKWRWVSLGAPMLHRSSGDAPSN